VDAPRGQAFIARAAELDRLAAALARAVAGETRTMIVAGEAGIGKTRLVRAFADRVGSMGGRVLTGGCLPLGTGGLPYAPFVEAFRDLFHELDPGALPALLGPNRGELARLMPELRARPDRPTAADPVAGSSGWGAAGDDRFAQVRLFELVLGVVDRLARDTPAVFVIEDLQWADPSTRDLLAFLVRNLRDERVLLVATIRTDELEPHHEVMTHLAELERGERVDRIDLERLDRDDLVRMVADELGRMPEPDLAARIWERTGGNPFYAEQVLAADRETSDGVLPPRLRDVVLARLAAVSEAGQEVLRVASAAGGRIDDELVAAVAELPPAVVRAALREVVDRRILIAAGGTADPHFVFRHALLQEVIHGDLFPGERARCHAGFALALEARAADRALGRSGGGPAPTAEELAYHWDAAGDERRALAATIEAGRAAELVYAWLDAHRHYLRAIELWERVGGAAQPASIDRTELLVRAAETAILIGQYRLAVELGRSATAGVDPAAEPARAAALHERQRWYLWEAGDRAAAAVALAEAERLIPTRPPSAARARILAHKAGIMLFGGRLAESIPVAEEAIAVAREAGSAADEALALGILGSALALTGRVDDGVDRLQAGLAIAEAIHSAEGIALGATNLAILLDRVGRTADALDVAVAGWERARTIGVERTYGGQLLAIAAKAAIALGRWDEAEAFLATGLDRAPVGPSSISLSIQRGRLATWRGELAAAADALAWARAVDDAAGGTDDRAALLAALAELAAIQGRATEARAAVAEGLRMAAGGPPDPALAQLAATGLRVEADAAASARARHDGAADEDARRRAGRIALEVERIAAVLGMPGSTAPVPREPSRIVALTALCRMEARRVEERDDGAGWAAVAEVWEAIGRPYPVAYARYRQAGAILRDRGPRPDARAALGTARGIAIGLAARPLLDVIDRLARLARFDLAAAGGGEAVAGPSAADAIGLTEREVEVLRLIAGGWTNQQIADALFISRKTASVHASHIFDKLGATNRAEAGAMAHRLGLAGDVPPPPGSAASQAEPTTPSGRRP
jgi:DNA-binding CsgD family transcriptional regulator